LLLQNRCLRLGEKFNQPDRREYVQLVSSQSNAALAVHRARNLAIKVNDGLGHRSFDGHYRPPRE
jgi:hypothetical protein